MRVMISIILMVIAAVVGFFFGAGMNEAIFIHPITFYCSPFLLDMLTQFLLCTKIIHNQTLAIIRLSEYNYTDNV